MPLPRTLLHAARLTVAGALSLALVGACSDQPSAAGSTSAVAPRGPAAGSAADVSADDAVDYVVAISVDGLNPHAIRELGRTGAPNFYRMLDNGATTQNARASYELTITLPNHTGMLTGRRITGTGGHHVTFNDDNGGTLAATAGGYVRGIFDVVHNHGGSTAFYSAKSKFDFLNRSWDANHGEPDTVGTDDGRDKIDRYYVDTESLNGSRLLSRMHAAPDELSFVHLAYPDRAGHEYGFMSAAYVHAVAQADHQLGRILAAVREDTRLLRHTNVILTADHGGKGASHSDPTRPYNYVIPFMVWGRGVARGADLYDLNTGVRARPALRRPTYAGTQPIRNAEVANLAADLLDLPVVPGSLLDASQDLDVR